MDVTMIMENIKFNYRVAGIIRDGEKILLHKCKDDEFYALPGGKIMINEDSKHALEREVMEEMNKGVLVKDLFSVVENFFTLKSQRFHEVLMIHDAVIKDKLNEEEKIKIIGIEKRGDLEFVWKSVKEIETIDLRPAAIKELILKDENNTKHLINIDEN